MISERLHAAPDGLKLEKRLVAVQFLMSFRTCDSEVCFLGCFS